ncbi:dienelactone hydrolase family protein [Flagellimonas baculiformis]|uniref:hypothetical protein n=1 Tax=Flagellimonas baculiformis TaxID=3067310 RepID=UPI00296F6076|nr:hypothetical protein [Muricauda sp. D6]
MKTNPKSLPLINLSLIFLLLLSSCSEDGIHPPLVLEPGEAVVSSTTSDTIVHVMVGNDRIPIYLSIPKDCEQKNHAAVVVMHGSDGMWANHDPSKGAMSGQFNEWRQLFDENCIVGAFVDSYSGRGVSTRTGKWTTAPDNFKISSQFVRPRDANVALSLLKNLRYTNGSSVVRPNDIGLLGFSDGATAVASTLYDTDATPNDWEWTQTFNGKEYDESSGVLAPEPRPEVGFATGVFYYGGSGGYDYWGSAICGPNAMTGNIYRTYVPILYQIPEVDDLTENTLCMFNVLEQKGDPVELHFYEGAEHGFDFDDNAQSVLARERTLNWFKDKLHIQE